MSLASNIVKRPGSSNYYARTAVPKDLQSVFRKREIWKSLETNDRKSARTKGAAILNQWQIEFDELRRRKEPTEADLQQAIWDHYQFEIDQDQNARLALPSQDKIDSAVALAREELKSDPNAVWGAAFDAVALTQRAAFMTEAREIRIKELKKHLASGEIAPITWAVDDVISRNRLIIDKDSSAYRDLCHRLQRATLEGLQRGKERDEGDWTGEPKDPLVAPPSRSFAKNARPGERIMELFDRFRGEKSGAVSADTWVQSRQIVQLFAEFVGESAHISAVNRKNVRDWKHCLSKWPRKAKDTHAFDGMSFRKVIEHNDVLGKPPISQQTINKYLAAMGGFCRWLLSNDFIEQDVMSGMYLEVDKNKRTRLPFDTLQLTAIFASPMFNLCAGARKEHEAGKQRVRDWRYWIPLISLYTGARLGEICQLLTADVRQLHDQWVFHITNEGSTEKSTKTDGSQRVVPMHSKLIELGFLEYHAALIAKGSRRLFPELIPDKRGFVSGAASSFFNDYFRRIGVKLDLSVNFHSFRHGVADAFRRAGYLDEQFGMLLGHTKATTTGRYGIVPQGILSQRVAMIEAIDYPGVVTG